MTVREAMESEVTRNDVEALHLEAAIAGDGGMVQTCERALDCGCAFAWNACRKAIREARARRSSAD